MNNEIRMSVSSMTRNDDQKGVYVQFTDNDKRAEFMVPECKIIRNEGFTTDELKQLNDYVKSEQDYIYSLAKTVDPLKTFLKERV